MINTWKELSVRQQIDTFLEYAEWLLFQSKLSGVVVDERSLNAVIMAKRIAFGSVLEGALDINKTMNDIQDVFNEHGQFTDLLEKKQTDEHMVAYICWCAFNGARREHINSNHSIARALLTCAVGTYILPVWDTGPDSPLSRLGTEVESSDEDLASPHGDAEMGGI